MIPLIIEITTNFIVGGFIVALITYCVKYTKPEIGALIWAAPVILLPTVLLLWYNDVSNKTIGDFVLIAIPYLFLTVIWQISFTLLLRYTIFKNDSNGVIKAIVISLVVWGVFALLFYCSNIHEYIKKL